MKKTIIFSLVITLCATQALAKDYYVAPNGNDSWSGSVSGGGFIPAGCQDDGNTSDCTDGPWRTIQYAVDRTGPGDSVTVKAGTYKESILFKTSGAASAPRVIKGEISTNGDLLTIIDPGQLLSGWEVAPEVGNSIYKLPQEKIGFVPTELTVDGKKIGLLHKDIMATGEGFQILATPADTQITTANTAVQIGYWDGIEALAGYKDGFLYIRFRDGLNPATKLIKAYQNFTMKLYNSHYNVIKDLKIVASEDGVIFGENVQGNVLENCRVECGANRIVFLTGASSNVVRNNTITMNYYGFPDLGPWLRGTEKLHGIRENIYTFFKYKVGYSTSDDISIYLSQTGPQNVIYGNSLCDSLTGITMYASAQNPIFDITIRDNDFSNIDSVALTFAPGVSNMFVYNNRFVNCAINLRLHEMNEPNTPAGSLYFYRNRCWLPRNVGRHILVHWLSTGNNSKYNTVWVLNNSFTGGYYGFYNASSSDEHILPQTYLVNNVFSTNIVFYSQRSSFYQNATALGGYDYNSLAVTGQQTSAPWFGNMNITESSYLWSEQDLSFSITGYEYLIDRGVNPVTGFSLNGAKLPGLALPGYTFNGAGPDLGALETIQQPETPPPSPVIDPPRNLRTPQ